MAHSLTSLPVRGALQVEAMEPTATQAVRESRSIHFHEAARATTTALSRTSTRVSGYIWRSWMAKLVICASGAENPGPDGDRLDLVEADGAGRRHQAQKPANSSRPTSRAMPRTRTRTTPMANAETAAAVGSNEYLRYANSSMGSGVSLAAVRKSERVKLSKEMAKAKIAPATTPGLITPRVTSKKARRGQAPRPWA